MPTMVPRTAISDPLVARLRAGAALGLDRTKHFFRRDRKIVDANADGVEDRVGDRRKHRIGAHLAWSLGAERTVGRGTLQDCDVVRADVAGTGHQIFDKVARAVRRIGIIRLRRFVERMADAHPRAADELLLDQLWIERAAEL